ncbi:MAG: hypothetical protein LIP08_04410 [Bacteroides sp.]|nr:hypothetical protein [Bacteroides sp.]
MGKSPDLSARKTHPCYDTTDPRHYRKVQILSSCPVSPSIFNPDHNRLAAIK